MNKQPSQKCESPLCAAEFEASGPQVRPKRYCSKECRQAASIIRRAAMLLDGLPPEAVLEMLARARDGHDG